MQRSKLVSIVLLFSILAATASGLFHYVAANRYSSPSYIIDASVGNSFGDKSSSTNYGLVSSGGESIIGDGSGGSYKLGQGYVAQLQQSLQMTVQPGNLIAYFPLDEGTGTATWDASASSNNGTGTNTTWTTGKISQALAMNGTDRYVNVPDSASLDPTVITVSAWLLSNGTTASETAFSKYDNVSPQNGEWTLGHGGTSSTYRFQIRVGGVNYGVESGTGFSTGTFHHVVGTYDGSNVRLYVDGVAVGTPAAISGTLAASSTAVRLGNRTGNVNYYDGKVDEAKIFSRALSDKEVKAEYDAGTAGNAAGISLNTIVAGTSQTANIDAIVQTDAPDYTLAVSQNQNLTSGANSIPAVSGSIASPVTWAEGTTKGLGFTLYDTTATAIPGKWSSGAAYAAFPGSATSFYDRDNFTAGAKDVLNMRLRADVAVTQAAADYTNVVTWTGTMIP